MAASGAMIVERLNVDVCYPSLRTVTVRDVKAFEEHYDRWHSLACDGPQKSPTLLPGWVSAYLRHCLKPDERWLCSFAYAGNRLVGVLPVIISPHPILGRHGPLLRTPFDGHTPSGDIPLAPDLAQPALEALLAEVAREVPGHLGLDMRAVRRISPVWLALQNRPKGYFLRRGLVFPYSLLDVRGNFDSYLSGLGRMRRTMKIGREKLEKLGTVSVEMRRGSEAGEDFLPEFLRLEASGWKGRMGTAILNDPKLVAFYTDWVRDFAAKGHLEWHVVRLDGRVIAAQMGICLGPALVLPKYAYDEDFAEFTPGHLLLGEVIKEAFARSELAEVNPMSDSNQHRLFRMSSDEYTDVHLVRRGVLPILFQLSGIVLRALYRDHVKPRLSARMKEALRKLKDRGNLALRRSKTVT